MNKTHPKSTFRYMRAGALCNYSDIVLQAEQCKKLDESEYQMVIVESVNKEDYGIEKDLKELAEYKNTGLTPEQIQEMYQEMNHLERCIRG